MNGLLPSLPIPCSSLSVRISCGMSEDDMTREEWSQMILDGLTYAVVVWIFVTIWLAFS